MKIPVFLLVVALFATASGQPKRSLLDQDPDVVYLKEHLEKPIELRVIKEAAIYADKEGNRSLGTVVTGQKVVLQAMTDRAYRVSAKTRGNKVTGWVGPGAFASKDPEFVEHLKQFYERQLAVAKLIAEHRAAIGMTQAEVGRALGSPTKTTVRQTKKGRAGKWEFIDYEEVRHYTYERDLSTGQVFRRLSHVTKEEKGRTVVEFENEVVTAIEESETRDGEGRVTIVVPPVVFW